MLIVGQPARPDSYYNVTYTGIIDVWKNTTLIFDIVNKGDVTAKDIFVNVESVKYL